MISRRRHFKRERGGVREVIDDALDEMAEDAEEATKLYDQQHEWDALNAQYIREEEDRELFYLDDYY